MWLVNAKPVNFVAHDASLFGIFRHTDSQYVYAFFINNSINIIIDKSPHN